MITSRRLDEQTKHPTNLPQLLLMLSQKYKQIWLADHDAQFIDLCKIECAEGLETSFDATLLLRKYALSALLRTPLRMEP